MSDDIFQLPQPGPAKPDVLRLVPLGGLGEVGRNMTVLETEGKILIVDCGVLFPEEIQPGVDLILPDFTYIQDRMDDVVGVVLTHGHEDHIGAVPYLLKLREDIPVYGSHLTIALVEPKLLEHRLSTTNLRVKAEGERLDLGPFHLEFCAVNHSIPDALAVMVRTKAGSALITGDFKMDQLPLDGRITDLRAFARWGEAGVDLFCVDSTNAEVPGFIASEREIGPVLEDVFHHATGQIVVASFASHVHRVQQVLNAAAKSNRKVALVGRSMERNMTIAAEAGYMTVPDGVLIDLKDVNSLPPERRVYMATGSQGEPMAALSRIANRTHRTISIGQGDTVVLASSLIPGNENSVGRVINQLIRLGAQVVHKGNSKVHVSGHAATGELLYAYNIVKPKNVMPIHGEIRHLVANGKHAVKTGVDPRHVMLAEDGVCVEVKNGEAQIVGQVPCDFIYVDGTSIGEIGESELYDRRVLAQEGFVAVYVVMEMSTGTILAGPTVIARGVAENDDVFRDIEPAIADALSAAAADGQASVRDMERVARRTLGRWVSKRLKRAPMIVPLVLEAD